MVKQGALLPRLWAWTWRGVCRHVCALYAFVYIPEYMSFSKTSSQALLLTTKRYLPPLGLGFRGAGAWSPAANPDVFLPHILQPQPVALFAVHQKDHAAKEARSSAPDSGLPDPWPCDRPASQQSKAGLAPHTGTSLPSTAVS